MVIRVVQQKCGQCVQFSCEIRNFVWRTHVQEFRLSGEKYNTLIPQFLITDSMHVKNPLNLKSKLVRKIYKEILWFGILIRKRKIVRRRVKIERKKKRNDENKHLKGRSDQIQENRQTNEQTILFLIKISRDMHGI